MVQETFNFTSSARSTTDLALLGWRKESECVEPPSTARGAIDNG